MENDSCRAPSFFEGHPKYLKHPMGESKPNKSLPTKMIPKQFERGYPNYPPWKLTVCQPKHVDLFGGASWQKETVLHPSDLKLVIEITIFQLDVHPWKLTWQWKKQPWMKMYFPLKMVIFPCHLSFHRGYTCELIRGYTSLSGRYPLWDYECAVIPKKTPNPRKR